MDNHVKHPLLGDKTFHMNCMATAKGGGNLEPTLATVKAAPGANGATVAENKAGDKKSNNDAKKGSEAKGTNAKSSESNSANSSTVDSDGLIREDTDSSVDASTTSTDEGMPGWGIALIVIVCLAAVGGIGYGIYRAQQKKKGNA